MKFGLILIFSFFLIFAKAQLSDINNIDNELLTESVIEDDSLVLSNIIIEQNLIVEKDSLVELLNPNSLYKNWNTKDIVYRTDTFKHSFDSITLVLADTANNLIYCHPFNGNVTSHFGYRRYRQHYGTDIDLVTGDTVRAAFDGKIRVTKYSRSFGKIIVIRHNNDLETVYAHLSKILVDSNQIIKAGQIIGLGGNTGRSTGSHLHYEVRYMGRALDAENIIDFEKGELLNDTIIISEASFGYLSRIAANKNAKYHYVHSGDTLYGIARKYHTGVSKLCYYNGINQTAILQIGQKLRIK